MKRKLLSILSLVLFAVFSVCVFAGCGKDPTGPTTPETPQAPTPTPAYTREGDYIYFGEYPQSLKASNVTVSEFTDNNGYYIGSDGAKYVKKAAYSYSNVFKNFGFNMASNGTVMDSKASYYFKVEQLKWRILKEEDGKALIVCDTIIDGLYYQSNVSTVDGWDYGNPVYATDGTNILLEEDGVTQVYANNYKYSQLREFLTQEFYSKAFDAEQKALIQLTTVDNSVNTTGESVCPCVCANTEDYIFALSYRDVNNKNYGFSTNNDRCWYVSDFAKAAGVFTLTPEYIEWMTDDIEGAMLYINSGEVLLRSPYSVHEGYMSWYLNGGYSVDVDFVDYRERGVVPALYINL